MKIFATNSKKEQKIEKMKEKVNLQKHRKKILKKYTYLVGEKKEGKFQQNKIQKMAEN